MAKRRRLAAAGGDAAASSSAPKLVEFVLCPDLSNGRETAPIPCMATTQGVDVPAFTYEKFNLAGPEVDLVPLEADYSGRCCCASAPTPAECTCVGGGGGGGGAGAALGTPGTGDYQAPLFECTSGCSCPAACGNRSSQRGVGVPVEVFEAPGRGFGLRAAADIRKGQYCCSYNGEIVTMAEARRRLQACDATKQSNYLLVLREHIGTRILRTHIDNAKIGNVARFINHSCSANLEIRLVRVASVVPTAALYAAAHIPARSELTFDYGNGSTGGGGGGGGGGRVCRCGTAACRGTLPFNADL